MRSATPAGSAHCPGWFAAATAAARVGVAARCRVGCWPRARTPTAGCGCIYPTRTGVSRGPTAWTCWCWSRSWGRARPGGSPATSTAIRPTIGSTTSPGCPGRSTRRDTAVAREQRARVRRVGVGFTVRFPPRTSWPHQPRPAGDRPATRQRRRLAVLPDALDGVVLFEGERVTVAWLAGWPAAPVERFAAVIRKARTVGGRAGDGGAARRGHPQGPRRRRPRRWRRLPVQRPESVGCAVSRPLTPPVAVAVQAAGRAAVRRTRQLVTTSTLTITLEKDHKLRDHQLRPRDHQITTITHQSTTNDLTLITTHRQIGPMHHDPVVPTPPAFVIGGRWC